jgi:hypothetical protein
MQWAPSASANVGDPGLVSTTLLSDGNHSTEETNTGAGTRSITAIADYGAPVTVRAVECRFHYNAGVSFDIHYSTNGTSWTAFGTPPFWAPGSCSEMTLNDNRDLGAGNGVSARYIRATMTDSGCGTNQATITEFRGLDDSLAYLIEPAPPIVETVSAKFGMKAGASDTLDTSNIIEVVFAKFGMRAAIHSSTPPIIYIESPEAKVGMKAATTATGQQWVESTFSSFGIRVGLTDIFTDGHIAETFLEFPEAYFGMKAGLTAQLITADISIARLALKAGQLDQHVIDDVPAAKLGMSAGLESFVIWGDDPVTVKMGMKAGSVDESSMFDTVEARAGMRAAVGVEQLVGTDTPEARFGMKSAITEEPIIFTESVTSLMAMRAEASSEQISVDAPAGRFGMMAGLSDVSSIEETTSASFGMKASASEMREIIDIVAASMGIRAGVSDQGVYLESPAASIGIRAAAMVETSGARLIPNIRSVIKAIAPEINHIAESMTEAVESRLTTPYAIIDPQDPTPDTTFAVNDEAVWVAIDIILVDEPVRNSQTDNPERLRLRLEAILRSLLLNHEQRGFAMGNPAATTTVLVATPMERATDIQERLLEKGDEVTVQIATIQCLTIMQMADA